MSKSTKAKKRTVIAVFLLLVALCIVGFVVYKYVFIKLDSLTAEYKGGDVEVGGEVNREDIVVTAKFSNGDTQVVSVYELTYDFSSTGSQLVSITFRYGIQSKSATFYVKVVDKTEPDPQPTKTLESITAVYNGQNIKVGGTLNNGDITVTAYYSDTTNKQVTNFTVGNFSSAAAGVSKVTVSYTENGVTKECNVNITIVDDSQQVISDSNLSVHFLELGNQYTGDCVYIKAGETDILIDAGSRKESAETIANYVDNYCTDNKLEYVIATHAHQDHIAGFVGTTSVQGIFEHYECENIIQFARTDANSEIYKDFCKARDAEIAAGANHYSALDCVNNANGAQKVYDLTGDGAITMEILYQKFYEESSSDENNYSVCLVISQGSNHYLFTGDLEESGERSLVESNPDLPEMVLFKGGHHGSYTASNEVLLSKIKPQYICICCCAGNVEYTQNLSRTFPAQEMIDRIAKYTDQVYVTTLGHIKRNADDTRWVNDGYTSMNGNIVFSCVNGAVSVNCSNNNLKLKDTEWFKNNRTCPSEWANDKP